MKMKTPEIAIIAALSENRAIGKDNKLLWRIPEDLKRFRELTTGHPVIMGRRTFESIVWPLPERVNIIVTRDESYAPEGCIICHSLDKAIETARKKDHEKIFIIGGGEIYGQTIDQADRLYLTVIEGQFEADTFFPDYSDFKRVVFEKPGESGGLRFRFLELEREVSDGS